MPKIRIYEVNYTNTDETFYVTTKLYENAKKYEEETLEKVYRSLENDGWIKCGKVNRANEICVDMFNKDGVYIAVCEE